MPGLVGYYDPQGVLPQNILSQMRFTMAPPLDEGSVLFSKAWAGVALENFNELPVLIEQGDQFLAILGEVEDDTNYQDIFRKDLNSLSSLHGSFIFVELNKTLKEICIITDRFGGYPCYIAKFKSATLFATQLKSLINVLPNASLDQQSIAMMLSIGEVLGNRTLVNEAATLPAASLTTFTPDIRTDQKIYWRYVHSPNSSIKRDDLIDASGKALSRAVIRNIRNHPKVCIPLSGGLDSRFILGLAKQQDLDINAYTWGKPGCRDLCYAKKVTQSLEVPHHTYIFDANYLSKLANKGVWLTEGNIPAVHFHVLPYAKEVNKSGHDVLLDGFAGDAILGGNFIGKHWLNNADLENAGKHLWHWRLSAFLPSVLNEDMASHHDVVRDEFVGLYKGYAGESSMDKCMAFLLDNRVRRITTCGTEIFRSEVMVKQPFMDIDVINVTRQIPHEWKIRHRFYLDVLNKFAPEVSRQPWQRTCLPTSVPYWMTLSSLAFQKLITQLGWGGLLAGKSPSQFDLWFRNELKLYSEEILFSETTMDRGVLPIDTLKKAWSLHQQGKIDASNLIGSALTIELFCRLFLDDIGESINKYSSGPQC